MLNPSVTHSGLEVRPPQTRPEEAVQLLFPSRWPPSVSDSGEGVSYSPQRRRHRLHPHCRDPP